ncbi:hypothetical protein [Pelomonas sp. KK5]|uniref:hypothetical protein n=1 Tax=Pelomonas sp. KK5 TaxID=1855730 RepID=UPI00117C1F5C|nr:hypothetical protein [Pelomonas sp. KK5]
MPRLVPSKVRESIALLRNNVAAEAAQVGQIVAYNRSVVQAIIDLVDQIPTELVALPPEQYASFSVAVSVARHSIVAVAPGHNADQAAMVTLPIFGGHTAVRVIYDSLGMCSDEAANPQTAGLGFIADGDFREGLRTDISTATSALANHEYKGATVLAGAVVEALLLWGLEHVGEANVRQVFQAKEKRTLEWWALGDLIGAAHACKLISDSTKKQAELAQDFRNLIHPGRAQRLDARCTLGTAYSALAAVDAVSVEFAAYKWQPSD